MKTKELLLFVILLITILSIGIFYACNKSKNNGCATCKTQPNGEKLITIKSNNDSYQANVKYYFGKKPNIKNLEVGTTLLSSKDFDRLLESFTELKLKVTPFSIVLYFSGDYNNLREINLNNILGFGTYYILNSKMYYSFFSKDQGNFKELLEYNLEVRSIAAQNLSFFALHILSFPDPSAKAYLLINNSSFHTPELSHSRDAELLKQVEFLKHYTWTLKEEGGGGANCESPPCDLPTPNEMCKYDSQEDDWECWPRICLNGIEGQTMLLDTPIGKDSINAAFDVTLQYTFRDSVLNKSNLGQEYIGYYYSISSFLGDSVPLTVCLETATDLWKYKSLLSKLIDTTGISSQILIDNTCLNDLNHLISSYKNISSDTSYQNMLNDINSDLNNKYSNKTIHDIYTILHK